MKNREKRIKKKKFAYYRVRQILNVFWTCRYICPLIKIPVAVKFNKFVLRIRTTVIPRPFRLIGPVLARSFSIYPAYITSGALRARVTSIADREMDSH